MKKFMEENFYFSLFSENPLKLSFSIGFGRAKSQENFEGKIDVSVSNFMKATAAEPMKKKVNYNYCTTARRFDEMRKDAIKAEISILNINFKYIYYFKNILIN